MSSQLEFSLVIVFFAFQLFNIIISRNQYEFFEYIYKFLFTKKIILKLSYLILGILSIPIFIKGYGIPVTMISLLALVLLNGIIFLEVIHNFSKRSPNDNES